MARNRPRGKPLQERELQALISIEIKQAETYDSGQISESRRENLDYYLGNPLGNEVDGRSQVVTSDVQDVVESIMPDMMEIFSAADEMVRYEPVSQEDEEFADQATDYANFIVYKDNPGFVILHDAIKDGLIQKTGTIKASWDATPITKQDTFSGVDEATLAVLQAEEDVEITEFDQDEDGTYTLTVERKDDSGRVKLENVPPEQFGTSRRARDLDSSRMLFQRDRKTFSELMEMGFPQDLIETLETDEADYEYDEEWLTRFDDEELGAQQAATGDPALKSITFFEAYPMLDWDGDGIAERHLVYAAGSNHKVLPHPETGRLATKVDDHPFVNGTPIKMPHKLIGRALADLVKEIQAIRTTVVRQSLDNMYLASNQRMEVAKDGAVDETLDDLLNNAPGAPIRTRRIGSIAPVPHNSILGDALGHLEHWNQEKESRTGVTRYNQGLDAQSLNKTATGIQSIIGQAQKRKMLIARTYAETMIKDLFRKILRLIVNHQNKPRMIRLRNEWVEMDPRSWNAEMDVTVDVGLGYGTKEQQVQADMQLLQLMAQGVQLGAATGTPIFSPDNFHNVFKRLARNLGWKNPADAVTDPKSPEGQQLAQMAAQAKDKPDPKMIEVQAKIETDKAQAESKMAIEGQKAQLDAGSKQQDIELSDRKANADITVAQMKAEAEIAIAWFKAEKEMEIAAMKAEAQIEVDREKAENAAATADYKAQEDARIKSETAKSKGNGESK